MTRQIWHEVSIWSSVSTHPNIVALLGITMHGKQVVTLSEYCDEGSLYDANLRHLRHSMASPLDLVDVSLAPAEVAQRPAVQLVAWVEGLASALSYLHALTPTPVMHRNLKSSNCMLSHGGAKLRLTDFTTACLAFPAADLTPRMGSVRWMAPEVLTDRPYGPPADMYGFGMVCYEMVSYQVPFADCTIAQACVKASAGERPPIPKGCPEWLQTLMLAAWRPEPEVRPDFASTHKTLSALKKATLTTSAGNVGRGVIPFLSATLGALTASPSALLARTRPPATSMAPSAVAAPEPAAVSTAGTRWAAQPATAGNASPSASRAVTRAPSLPNLIDVTMSRPRHSTASPEATSPSALPTHSKADIDQRAGAYSTPATAPASPPESSSSEHAYASPPLATRPEPHPQDEKQKEEDCAMAILQISQRAAFQEWTDGGSGAHV